MHRYIYLTYRFLSEISSQKRNFSLFNLKGVWLLTAILTAFLVGISLVFFNAVIFHFYPIRRKVRVMIWIWVLHAPLIPWVFFSLNTLSLESLVPTQIQFGLWSLLGFTIFVYLYTNAYFTALISLTVNLTHKILCLTFDYPQRTISRQNIYNIFSFRNILDNRIDCMVAKGLLIELESPNHLTYLPSRRTMIYGFIFHKIKDFLKWGDGG